MVVVLIVFSSGQVIEENSCKGLIVLVYFISCCRYITTVASLTSRNGCYDMTSELLIIQLKVEF